MRMWINDRSRSLLAVSVLTTLAMACSQGSLKGGGGTGSGGMAGTGSAGMAGTGSGGTAGTGSGGAAGTGGGGMAGTGGGGAPGTGSGGTTGSVDAGVPLTLPDCLAFLIDSCAPVGACVSSPLDAFVAPDICFETGVHVTQT